jgi:hypothetical protein
MADWKDGLPEEMRGNPGLKDIKDLGGLAKSYLDAQSMIGSSVRLPTKDGGEEGRKAFRARMLEVGKDYGLAPLPGEDEDDTPFYTSLGRPEKAAEYPLPEGIAADGDLAPLLEAAHGAKLTKKQFKALYEKLDNVTVAQGQATLAKIEEDGKILKKEWGDAHDKRRSETANMMKAANAPADLIKAFEEGRVNSASTKWLYETLTALGGESTDMGTQGKRKDQTGVLSPDEAAARLDEIDTRIANMNVGDADYQALLQRRLALIKQAHPA